MEVEWSDEDIYTAVRLETLIPPSNENSNESEQPGLPSDKSHASLQSEHDLLESGDPLLKPESKDTPQESQKSHTEPTTEGLHTALNIPTLESPEKITLMIKQISEKQHSGVQGSSDEDIPLAELRRKIHGHNRRRNVRTRMTGDDDETDDNGNDENVTAFDSDFDANYTPSSECSSCSDDYQTPVIEKRKRKWVRKRIRPLKRELGRKENRKPTKCLVSGSKPVNEDGQLTEALHRSKQESKLNKLLKGFAERRLTNLLSSNGLQREQISPDGNCFFNAIGRQTNSEITVTEFRSELCSHLKEYETHYIGYMSSVDTKCEADISKAYVRKVDELMKDGIWDTEMSDVLPLAAANMLRKHITIYTSKLQSPIIHVSPDIEGGSQVDMEHIKIAYLALPGYEHYDSCVSHDGKTKSGQPTCSSSSEKQILSDIHDSLPKTPTKRVHTGDFATPRKKAEYVSPKKIKLSRKRTPLVQKWKKNIRKTKRNTGLAYISDASNKTVEPKKVLPATCRNCKNKCDEKVCEEAREQIFKSYYDLTMTFERKRDFICQHVDVQPTSNRYGRTKKHHSRRFHLPVEKQRMKVCKSFFLNTLNIGKKVVDCALQRKKHGRFHGTDQRGIHSPANKTDDSSIQCIKEHIASFPVVESHYRRKSTSRQYLSQDLSIRKMYELYKTKSQEEGKTVVSEKVYRNIFCTEFNLSFHKPKKDTCQVCNTFNERTKTGTITENDEMIYNEHLKRKEESRIEKDNDKKKAKTDKDFYVATFDLQAVLQTPCSNVSQAYYKRKLNSYNLTVYSLGDSKGTCYIWNETHGQRGSSEIGTCILTHLNSLPSNIKHVVLYSDCCSGQNRNQFLASGLLHTVLQNANIDVIEQKFLESGHTQMECDSMHSAIEHAKKQTSLFVPEQWDTIFQMARRQKPYTVVPLRFNNFFDLKKYAKENFKNFKINSEGIKVNWLKVKILKVQKNTPDQIFVKYNFTDSEFASINVRRAQRGRPGLTAKMSQKYTEKLPISVAKKNDLLDLCKGYVIPEIYWPYYDSLPTNKKVNDYLACADVLDGSESDTDDEL